MGQPTVPSGKIDLYIDYIIISDKISGQKDPFVLGQNHYREYRGNKKMVFIFEHIVHVKHAQHTATCILKTWKCRT